MRKEQRGLIVCNISGILIPACLDALREAKSPLTGDPVHLVAAGGIVDGRGLAASLAYGAQAVGLSHPLSFTTF